MKYRIMGLAGFVLAFAFLTPGAQAGAVRYTGKQIARGSNAVASGAAGGGSTVAGGVATAGKATGGTLAKGAEAAPRAVARGTKAAGKAIWKAAW